MGSEGSSVTAATPSGGPRDGSDRGPRKFVLIGESRAAIAFYWGNLLGGGPGQQHQRHSFLRFVQPLIRHSTVPLVFFNGGSFPCWNNPARTGKAGLCPIDVMLIIPHLQCITTIAVAIVQSIPPFSLPAFQPPFATPISCLPLCLVCLAAPPVPAVVHSFSTPARSRRARRGRPCVPLLPPVPPRGSLDDLGVLPPASRR